MFQIVNNKVFITRGQTAVYSREVRRNDSEKSPYVLPNWSDVDSSGNLGYVNSNGKITGIRFPTIRFSVKRNIYSTEKTLDYFGEIIPKTIEIVDVNSGKTPDNSDFLNISSPKTGNRYFIRSGGDYVGQIYEYDGLKYNRVYDYLPIFMTQEITDYIEGDTVPKYDRLYRERVSGGVPSYFYFDNNNEKHNYNFVINVSISSEDTIQLTPGTYYYEISIINKDNGSKDILYKDVLLEPTEFVIGGSNVNE